MNSDPLLVIDGSYGEGGGQILRNALALSMLAGQGMRMTNIRANRKNPGLRPQHLTAVKGAGLISNAEIEGAETGGIRNFSGSGSKPSMKAPIFE